MSFTKTLVNGNNDKFDAGTLTPMQKLTLRFVVSGWSTTDSPPSRAC